MSVVLQVRECSSVTRFNKCPTESPCSPKRRTGALILALASPKTRILLDDWGSFIAIVWFWAAVTSIVGSRLILGSRRKVVGGVDRQATLLLTYLGRI